MARIEWVKQMLNNWAMWCRQRDDGGLGYPTRTAFANLGGRGSRAEATVPILAVEAEVTNQAVQSLRISQKHLHDVLMMHYAKGIEIPDVARRLGRVEGTIRKNLEDADFAIARWYQDRKTAAEKRADACTK